MVLKHINKFKKSSYLYSTKNFLPYLMRDMTGITYTIVKYNLLFYFILNFLFLIIIFFF